MEQTPTRRRRSSSASSGGRRQQPQTRRPAPKKRKRRSIGWTLYAILVVISAIIVGVYAAGHFFIKAPPIEGTEGDVSKAPVVDESTQEPEDPNALIRKEGVYNFLLLGKDVDSSNTDTLIVVSYDTVNQKIGMVSIPRDTAVTREWSSMPKINAAFHSKKAGPEVLKQEIKTTFGIPIDYYVHVDLQGFIALVDELGGEDIEVPLDMNYDDPYQGLSIHFSKGTRHLNGAEALKVVRFRHNNDGTGYGSEDIGRMQTQQAFLKAVAKQTLTLSNLDKLSDFVKIFQNYVETDLTINNLAWLGKEAIEIGAENIDFSTLPNDWKSPYIYLDPEETLVLVNQYLNPYVEDRVMEDLHLLSK